jgi:arsenate reductase
MADNGRLFHNPYCSKSRAALELLQLRGVDPQIVSYLEQAPSIDDLHQLLRMLGTGPLGVMRTGEPEYTDLGLDGADVDDDALLAALHANPQLLERPIYVRGGRAVIGRPPERVLELLDQA